MHDPFTAGTIFSAGRFLLSATQEKRKRKRAYRDIIAITLGRVDDCKTENDLWVLHQETAPRIKEETHRLVEDISPQKQFRFKLACDNYCNAHPHSITGYS